MRLSLYYARFNKSLGTVYPSLARASSFGQPASSPRLPVAPRPAWNCCVRLAATARDWWRRLCLLRQGRARGGGRTRRRWRRAEAWRRGRFRDDHLGRFCFAIAAALVGNGSGATDRFAAHVQLPLEPHLRFSQPRPLIARSLAVEIGRAHV